MDLCLDNFWISLCSWSSLRLGQFLKFYSMNLYLNFSCCALELFSNLFFSFLVWFFQEIIHASCGCLALSLMCSSFYRQAFPLIYWNLSFSSLFAELVLMIRLIFVFLSHDLQYCFGYLSNSSIWSSSIHALENVWIQSMRYFLWVMIPF